MNAMTKAAKTVETWDERRLHGEWIVDDWGASEEVRGRMDTE